MAIEESDIPIGYDFAGASAEAEQARAAFLATIPDDELTREYMRRHNERRAWGGGRQPVLRICPKGCGQELGCNAMRKHIPLCDGKPAKKRSRKVTR